MKAISQSTGRSTPQVKTDLAKLGDLGLVAQNSKGKQPTLFKLKALTVPQVFARFTEIANISGASVRSCLPPSFPLSCWGRFHPAFSLSVG